MYAHVRRHCHTRTHTCTHSHTYMSMQAHVLTRLLGVPLPAPLAASPARRVSLICMRRAQNGNLLPHCSLPSVGNLPRHLPPSPASPTPLSLLPSPHSWLSHIWVLVAILMCQVFYLRVLPTLILFAHLPGKSGRKPANSANVEWVQGSRSRWQAGRSTGRRHHSIVGVLRYPVDLLLCLIHAQIVAEIWRQVY